MIIKKHVILLILLLIAEQHCLAHREFPLNLWKNYHLDSQQLVISHSNHPHAIYFQDRVQEEWIAEYQLSDEKILIEFKRNQQLLQVVGRGESLLVRGLKEGETLLLSSSLLQATGFEIILQKDGAVLNAQIGASGQVVVQGFNELVYRPKGTSFGSHFQQQKSSVAAQSQQKLAQFFSFYKINETYLSFGKAMLSKTFSQLCKQQVKELSFIGICYNVHEGKRHNSQYRIDIRYSALIIDRLSPIYPSTALFLFEHLFSLIQDTIFYSDAEFVQIPEHVEVIRGFIAALKKSSSLQGKLVSRVKSVLNGLMNQMLLSDVNALEEEINYRENKKMHPTLVKMLSLKWKSHSRKNALSSIYQESFTPDYFYNYAHQHIDTCVSKVAWLTAAAAEFVLLVKNAGSRDDIDALEQPTSLFKILQQVTNADNHAKQGRYYSINEAEGVRLYAQQVGYESFLPYTYELTSIFPEQFLKNVTTPFGLASLNLNHPKFSDKFEFRGNVQLYFNYKILFEARRRIEASKNQRPLQPVNELISRLRSTILSFWQQGKHFTLWNASGAGLRERKGLSLLSLLALAEKR